MIFTIICEELGLAGAGIIVFLFLLLIWRFFLIASGSRDLFGALIATGAMAHMMIQVILNIAVVTASIPNTGVILPFISYVLRLVGLGNSQELLKPCSMERICILIDAI